LLYSNSNEEDKEIKGEKQKQPILVEGAALYNKDVMVDELLDGSYDEEDKTSRPVVMRIGTRRQSGGEWQLLRRG
jgi:hypothetical protein